MIAGEMRLYLGLRAQLARRDRGRQHRLSERLQRRQVDLIDRHLRRNLRMRQIERALDRDRAAAANLTVNGDGRGPSPYGAKILKPGPERVHRERGRERAAAM